MCPFHVLTCFCCYSYSSLLSYFLTPTLVVRPFLVIQPFLSSLYFLISIFSLLSLSLHHTRARLRISENINTDIEWEIEDDSQLYQWFCEMQHISLSLNCCHFTTFSTSFLFCPSPMTYFKLWKTITSIKILRGRCASSARPLESFTHRVM